jgi:gamma-glutamyltranspeptidase
MNFEAQMTFASRRSSVLGRDGMVATSQTLAVAAGLEILRAGGNAVDAAVATAAALNITEPTSTGIGGDCFALFFSAKNKEITALTGSGRAPQALTLDLLAKQGFSQALPPYHAHTATVPGAAAGWCDLVEKHGRLKIKNVLAPAIRLAESGFPVAPITAYYWQRGAENQLSKTQNGRIAARWSRPAHWRDLPQPRLGAHADRSGCGLDPQAALDRPRFCIEDGTAGGSIALEEGIPQQAMAALEKWVIRSHK